jgi:hypothetical protein
MVDRQAERHSGETFSRQGKGRAIRDRSGISGSLVTGKPWEKAKGEIAGARDLSRYRGPTSAAFAVGHLDRRSVVNGNIFNSKGVHVGVVTGDAAFGLKGQKLYDLKGSNIYRLNGDLVGHLSDARGKEKRLDKTTDKLFPEG